MRYGNELPQVIPRYWTGKQTNTAHGQDNRRTLNMGHRLDNSTVPLSEW